MTSALSRRLGMAGALVTAALAACSTGAEHVAAPVPSAPNGSLVGAPTLALSASGVVISQVYGGGGNSGATYRNDYIELFNSSASPVSLAGWSVQYASAGGTSWQVTQLSGSIPAGGYYLIKEAAGAGGTTDLPGPDLTAPSGGISMSATAGKVALVNGTTALSGSAAGSGIYGGTACPANMSTVVDFVAYGSGVSCFEGSAGAPATANATASLRAGNGATDTDRNSADFSTGAPNPRTSGGGGTCTTVGAITTVTLAPSTATINAGASQTFTAAAKDAAGCAVTTTFAWTNSNPSAATLNTSATSATNTATGQSAGGQTQITATANGVTASATLTVNPGTTGTPSITITGRNSPTATSNPDPPLPVGYQDQLFATVRDGNGVVVSGASVTWGTTTPALVSVDQLGNVTSLAAGTATVTATALNGTANGTYTVRTSEPPDGPAVYANHLEFGRPTLSSFGALDEILVTWPEYVSSYSPTRGQPNWVAYELEQTHRGPADRCDCFTPDPSLPANVPRILTTDYTGSGFSRGHMTMSEDRTSGGRSTTPVETSVDNARTFLLSNVIPQHQNNNGGPWLTLENYLGGLAESGTKEIYIYAGGAAYSGTLANSGGKVAIPTHTWKVALITNRDKGLADVAAGEPFQVIAVDMPNDASASGDWTKYQTTVDAVEALTGFDFFANLPDALECRVEQAITPVANCVPEARLWTAGNVTTVRAGTPLVFNTAALDDATDAPWRYVLSWGDGTSMSATLSALPAVQRPLARSKTWTVPGTYTVTLSITDKNGNTGTKSMQVVVTP